MKPRGRGPVSLHGEQMFPCAATVNCGGAVELAGKMKLGDKHGFLLFIVARIDSMVEADLADDGGRIRECAGEACQPLGGAIADIPGVETKSGKDS